WAGCYATSSWHDSSRRSPRQQKIHSAGCGITTSSGKTRSLSSALSPRSGSAGGVDSVEVVIGAAGGGPPLTLVTRADFRGAIGKFGGGGELEQTQLTDLHPGPKGDG